MYNIINKEIKLIESGKRKEKHMQDMGMTDKQFNGFLRQLIKNLKTANENKNEEEKTKEIKEIIEDLQKTIED